jgi:hypothetical protein
MTARDRIKAVMNAGFFMSRQPQYKGIDLGLKHFKIYFSTAKSQLAEISKLFQIYCHYRLLMDEVGFVMCMSRYFSSHHSLS